MVLVSLQYLLDRIRYPRSRADELAQLRARFARVPRVVSAREQETARRMLALRCEISKQLQGPRSCSTCSRGHPRPAGRWDGGHCCSGSTAALFTDEEVAALAAAGVTSDDLQPPRGDHAGCVFRGPEGCSLTPRARPNLCVRYLCRTLEGELSRRGDLERIESLGSELRQLFEAFVAARERRIEEAFFADLITP